MGQGTANAKMEKVIVRSRISAHPSSNYINKHYENELQKNVNTLLAVVYEDDESYEKLIKEYNNTLNGESSTYFFCSYLLENGYAVVLDSHITIYKLCTPSKEKDENKILWRYYSNSKYLGDTWWFSDDEIIRDLSTLSIVEFLKKYRGL